jgi:hypothetical protein
VGASFKLFESFEGLVDRDAISADLERKHAELIRSFVYELQEASAGKLADGAHPDFRQAAVVDRTAPWSGHCCVGWDSKRSRFCIDNLPPAAANASNPLSKTAS